MTNKIKRLFESAGLLILLITLASWGSTGHYKINHDASLSFNQEMDQFFSWATTLAEHASDADWRKNTDPTEGPKHYIDIDNYPEFISSGRIAHTLDSVIQQHGSYFVYDNGVLPWATLATIDSLKNCFERNDWDKAVLFAADLGHYVADGHMPLHITRNYNGQYSGNNGIHSRYESTMINAYISQFNYTGQQIYEIPDVREYVFSYLYENYTYLDSVLAADDYAKSISSNTNSYAYKQALWEKSQSFTIPLFKNASHAIAELIYTTWVAAGKPSMSSAGISDQSTSKDIPLISCSPNPFTTSTAINFKIHNPSATKIVVYSSSGNVIETLIDNTLPGGEHQIDWIPSNLNPGIYYLAVETKGKRAVKRIVYLD